MPAGTPSQTTSYAYGTSTNTSGIASNDLLATTEYPDLSGGYASSLPGNRQDDTFDALGERLTHADRNGNVHADAYDVLGRMTSDSVTTLGSGVDGSIRRLGYSYNTQGLPYQLTSYSDAAGTTVVNQVQEQYDGLGQLTAEYQAHAGAVNTSTTSSVQYGYSDLGHGSRMSSMTYPNGRVLTYSYGSAGGVNDSISRVAALTEGTGTNTATLEGYSYLGLSTIVQKTRGNGVSLSYVAQPGEASGDAGDQYTGLDRFGRVADQRWLTASSGASVDRFGYGYDRDSNVLYKNNLGPGTAAASFSELYHASGTSGSYDSLNRLVSFSRGVLSASVGGGTLDTVSTAVNSHGFGLDALGNWATSTQDGVSQSRTSNAQNELTTLTNGTNSAVTLTYDNAGNTTTDQAGKHFTYDAWGRMAAVKDASNSPLTAYAYDALGRRVRESPSSSFAGDLYYSRDWQVAEEQFNCGVARARVQYVWSLSYVNDLVLRDRDADYNAATGSLGASGSGLEERLWVQQDANHDVTSLTDVTGAVVNRYAYDVYGVKLVLDANWGTATDGRGWVYGFQGGREDPASGKVNFQHRDYDAATGRWMKEDPRDYIDGPNLFQAFDGNPACHVDPTGNNPPTTQPTSQPTTRSVNTVAKDESDRDSKTLNCGGWAWNIGVDDPMTDTRCGNFLDQLGATAGGLDRMLEAADYRQRMVDAVNSFLATNKLGIKGRLIDPEDFNSRPPGGWHRVRLYRYKQWGTCDFHWITQDTTGTWSGKGGPSKTAMGASPGTENISKSFVGMWIIKTPPRHAISELPE